MPELPEVEALTEFLAEQAAGDEVTRVDVASFSVLKTFDPPLSALVGRRFASASRRGKYLLLSFEDAGGGDPLWLVLHLSRGGWVGWIDKLKPAPVRPGKGPLHLRMAFASGGGF